MTAFGKFSDVISDQLCGVKIEGAHESRAVGLSDNFTTAGISTKFGHDT